MVLWQSRQRIRRTFGGVAARFMLVVLIVAAASIGIVWASRQRQR